VYVIAILGYTPPFVRKLLVGVGLEVLPKNETQGIGIPQGGWPDHLERSGEAKVGVVDTLPLYVIKR
jgi:hypothetical protein